MTDTLHSVARRMAAAGRLPGIEWDDLVKGLYPLQKASRLRPATEAELAWAAIQHAMDRKWPIGIDPLQGLTSVWSTPFIRQDGTTALSVLLAVERACDAAEGGSK